MFFLNISYYEDYTSNTNDFAFNGSIIYYSPFAKCIKSLDQYSYNNELVIQENRKLGKSI